MDVGEVYELYQNLLFDPETSGGLLMAVHPEDADALFEELKASVPCAQRIGVVTEKTDEFFLRLV